MNINVTVQYAMFSFLSFEFSSGPHCDAWMETYSAPTAVPALICIECDWNKTKKESVPLKQATIF